ncbi:MAG: Gfo/Idh/MocA family oxidoreductase, partial [Vicinamibacteria bacterium]|nr:Gfo/Idh/MocA family oxidoreductase [Vicinamibacteria bacterium]
MNRRDFMKTTVLATTGTAAVGRRAAAQAAPSDRLRVGFIGCGARAHQLMQAVVGMPGVDVVALCDAYTGRIDRARARTGGKATVYKDYRDLLASPSVDAVFIATPDHWHKTMALAALSASKDVYLEKPMSFSIADGLAIVDAVKRSDRILQVGSQGVSSPEVIKARELIEAGALGQVTMVRAAYNRNGDSGAWLYPIPPDAGPATVNWEQFLGPAPRRPFDLNRFFR